MLEFDGAVKRFGPLVALVAWFAAVATAPRTMSEPST